MESWKKNKEGFVVDDGLWNVLVTSMKESGEGSDKWVDYVSKNVLRKEVN
jgi:hypothetical protein